MCGISSSSTNSRFVAACRSLPFLAITGLLLIASSLSSQVQSTAAGGTAALEKDRAGERADKPLEQVQQTKPPHSSSGRAQTSETANFENSPIPHEVWFRLILAGRGVGYSRSAYFAETWHGQNGWRFEDDFHLFLTPDAYFYSTTIHHTRLDGSFLETTATKDDPGGRVLTHVVYSPHSIDGKTTHSKIVDGKKVDESQPVHALIPKGVVLSPQTPWEIAPAEVKTGHVVTEWDFDTDKLLVQKQSAAVGNPEMVILPSHAPVKAWKTRIHTEGDSDSDYTLWIDSIGQGVKAEMPMQGMTLTGILTPPDEIGPRQPPVPVWRVGREGTLPASPLIREPRSVDVMDLTITGVSPSITLPSDGPQTVIKTGPGVLHVSVGMPGQVDSPFAPRHKPSAAGDNTSPESVILAPVTGLSALPDAERRTFLASTTMLDADDPEIAGRAQMIVRGRNSDLERCMAIRDWVNSRMEEDAKVPVDRSALSVLHNPRGVCRDYASLYAALARAAGIPTRVCAGLVYDSGLFWGHAWDESWVGTWVAIDSTLGSHFVDATHVKLAEGDSPTAFQTAGAELLSLAASKATLHIDAIQPANAK